MLIAEQPQRSFQDGLLVKSGPAEVALNEERRREVISCSQGVESPVARLLPRCVQNGVLVVSCAAGVPLSEERSSEVVAGEAIEQRQRAFTLFLRRPDIPIDDSAGLPITRPFTSNWRALGMDDVKGDLLNLLLAFPTFEARELTHWIDGHGSPDEAQSANLAQELAEERSSAASGRAGSSALLRYALQVGEVHPEELRQLALEIGPVAHEAYMTAAQILTKESYAQGKADGEAKGKADGEAKGRADGEAKGRAEGKAELLVRLLGLRFGPLPDAIRERIAHASPDDLDVWAERIITGASLEEVLGR